MSKYLDLTGVRFGRWVDIEKQPGVRNGSTQWLCECDCGEKRVVSTGSLKASRSISCGCFKAERTSQVHKKHGLSGTSEFNIWQSMIARCARSTDKKYANYGGRGIEVCARWKESFQNFIDDMGFKPGSSFSIERVNVNGNYEPSNCEWADNYTQQRNTRLRKINTSGHAGVVWSKSKQKWQANITCGRRISLGTFENKSDAVKARKEAEFKYWGKSS